jgi:hypothetical protein
MPAWAWRRCTMRASRARVWRPNIRGWPASTRYLPCVVSWPVEERNLAAATLRDWRAHCRPLASLCRLPSLACRTITWIAGRRIGSRDGSDRRLPWQCWERRTDKTSRGVFETKGQPKLSRSSRAHCVISIPACPPDLPNRPRSGHRTLEPPAASLFFRRNLTFVAHSLHHLTTSTRRLARRFCCSFCPSRDVGLNFFVISSCQANSRLLFFLPSSFSLLQHLPDNRFPHHSNV